MGLFDRVRGATSPAAAAGALLEDLESTGSIRWPLYQDDERIGVAFQQRRKNVREVLASTEFGWEISGGYPALVGLKATKKRAESETIEITPLMQARLLEEADREAGRLVNLAETEPRRDALLLFVGEGHIFESSEHVTALPEDPFRLDSDTAAAVQERRRKDSFVWIARGRRLLGCTASMSEAKPKMLRRFPGRNAFGILGFLETDVEDMQLVAPLIIWYDEAARRELGY